MATLVYALTRSWFWCVYSGGTFLYYSFHRKSPA